MSKLENKFIPLSVPNFCKNEKDYVNDAVVSEWVSTGGSKVAEFEKAIAEYTSAPYAVACNSGTAGLHLAMLVSGVCPDDEVLAPALTFIAAVNPIRYANAHPVFIGCDDTLCMCHVQTEAFLSKSTYMKDGYCFNKNSNRRIRAMAIVHVFGNMADMPAFLALAKKYNLIIIEDATEALGTYYTSGAHKGKMAGTIGDIGVYSFNGNKLITTGSGGMIVTENKEWADRARHLSTQAKSDELYYTHDEIGYNYRLTNLQAALGIAQMESIESFIEHKNKMHAFYCDRLDGKNGFKILHFNDDLRSNKWFFSLYLTDSANVNRDEVIKKMGEKRIQTRPIWGLVCDQADYGKCEAYGLEKAREYLARIVNIPCSTNLSEQDAQRVVDELLSL